MGIVRFSCVHSHWLSEMSECGIYFHRHSDIAAVFVLLRAYLQKRKLYYKYMPQCGFGGVAQTEQIDIYFYL